MSVNHPEIPAKTHLNSAIAAQLLEINQINQEFLRLLLHPQTAQLNTVLGLHAGILDGLRRLSPEQQATVASVPLLLPEFSPMPGIADIDGVADRELTFVSVSELWHRELQGFSDRLLTCIWQAARRETGMAAVCMGIDVSKRSKLAQLSFVNLSRCSRQAATYLQARLAEHPNFWSDLIASARSTDSLRKSVSQLSVLQLSVVRQNTQASLSSSWPLRSAYR